METKCKYQAGELYHLEGMLLMNWGWWQFHLSVMKVYHYFIIDQQTCYKYESLMQKNSWNQISRNIFEYFISMKIKIKKIYYLKDFVKFLKNNFIWTLFRWLYKLTTVLFSEQTFFVIWLRRNVICGEIISTALPTHLQLFVYLGSSCFSFRGWGGQPPIYLMSFFFNFF